MGTATAFLVNDAGEHLSYFMDIASGRLLSVDDTPLPPASPVLFDVMLTRRLVQDPVGISDIILVGFLPGAGAPNTLYMIADPCDGICWQYKDGGWQEAVTRFSNASLQIAVDTYGSSWDNSLCCGGARV